MKILIKIFVNIVLIILVYFLFKYVSIFYSIVDAVKRVDFYWLNCVFFEKDYKSVYKKHDFVPPIISKNSDKKPIIIFGCSYAEGIHEKELDNKDKFSYKLYQETNRSVYNRAYSAQGLQYMLYQLEDETIYKEIPEPEYIVYVYITDHIRRMYQESCLFAKSLFYKKVGNDIVKITNPIYYTYPFIYLRRMKRIEREWLDDDYDFLRMHFIKAKQLSDKHWPNAKWIILLYDEHDVQPFEELKKYGFEIARAKDFTPEDFLTNLKYRVSETDSHPTKEAWQILTPEFAKRYIK